MISDQTRRVSGSFRPQIELIDQCRITKTGRESEFTDSLHADVCDVLEVESPGYTPFFSVAVTYPARELPQRSPKTVFDVKRPFFDVERCENAHTRSRRGPSESVKRSRIHFGVDERPNSVFEVTC